MSIRVLLSGLYLFDSDSLIVQTALVNFSSVSTPDNLVQTQRLEVYYDVGTTH